MAEDGTIKRLDDQLKAMRKANSFLFEVEEGTTPPPRIVAGGQPPSEPANSFRAALLKGAGFDPK